MTEHSLNKDCGGGGIRTPGGYKPSLVFKTSALNQALPPLLIKYFNFIIDKFNYLFLSVLIY